MSASPGALVSEQGYNQRGIRRQIGLAAKPIFHGIAQLIERNARANLEASVANWQRVVEHRSIREVAHAEMVEPLQRTGLELSLELVFDADSAGKHRYILLRTRRDAEFCHCFK